MSSRPDPANDLPRKDPPSVGSGAQSRDGKTSDYDLISRADTWNPPVLRGRVAEIGIDRSASCLVRVTPASLAYPKYRYSTSIYID